MLRFKLELGIDFTQEEKAKHHLLPTYRWSFYKDGFLTNHGHFQGSAVSNQPWEKCTDWNAILSESNSTSDKSTYSEPFSPKYLD